MKIKIYLYLKWAKSYFSGAYSPTLYHFTGFLSVNMNALREQY